LAAGARKDAGRVERQIADGRAMAGGDALQPVACQIAPGRDGCKIVVDLRHGAFPGGQRVPLDPSRVISGVNASNPLRKDRPMPVMTEPKLIAGNANKSLASAIARRMSMHRGMSVSLLNARVERFN